MSREVSIARHELAKRKERRTILLILSASLVTGLFVFFISLLVDVYLLDCSMSKVHVCNLKNELNIFNKYETNIADM